MLDKYRDYFCIDEDYFPAVTEDLINNGKVSWQKFYPHDTFVKLIKDVVSVLSRQQKLSIWVEGAYGTGKSHAVLTLKKLLDASEEDTKNYFQKFNLDSDLYNKFQNLKNQDKPIITVHRYGSSYIRNDNNLVLAIQESIKKALEDKGINYKGQEVLKDAVITWLQDEVNRNYFDLLLNEVYSDLFAGDKSVDIIEKLNSYSGESLIILMNKIFKVAEERGIHAFTLDIDGLVLWIKDIIAKNNLKAIVFIWDEFTNFFENNMRGLTGFQKIVEISETDPFYLIIVTHKSSGMFADTDKDKIRILDRFVKPTCLIELPENMAIKLMGAAMEKKEDQQVMEDWNITVDDLYDRTKESRKLVKIVANISDDELKGILPIHPYTALLLKYLSTAFNSNQRSMFDFIKNDSGENIEGFQWFINNYGPLDENPLLTIDMLWNFFYEKGREQLEPEIKSILDYFTYAIQSKMNNDEQRVLKVILLLQAISQNIGNVNDIFIPNEKNINNAFEGSDLENGAAGKIAEKLVRDKVIYVKSIGNNRKMYSSMGNAVDSAEIKKISKDISTKSTSLLVNEGELEDIFLFEGGLKLRYEFKFATADNFKKIINELRNKKDSFGNKILAVVLFARSDDESILIYKNIEEAIKDGSYDMIFIDTSTTTLGVDGFNQYIENMANSIYNIKKDRKLAEQYERNAKDILKKWKSRIENGEFIIYRKNIKGERVSNMEALKDKLISINKELYPCGIESEYSVIDNMYMCNSLASGVECGVTRQLKNTYRSKNKATKLEKALGDAWEDNEYWINKPSLLISKIKREVDSKINEAFKSNGEITISKIYQALKEPPYGFRPCNLTAFIMGFVLKEYTEDSFLWSDKLTSEPMSIAKLKEMVDEVIKLDITPNPRYKEKYIIEQSEEQKLFGQLTSIAFNIELNKCSSVEQARDRIRNKMKELSFPIWSLKYILEDSEVKSNKDEIIQLIDCYIGIANSNNIVTAKSEIDFALTIGRLYSSNKELANDLKILLTKENCKLGMNKYLKCFNDGELVKLAVEVNDGGQYINVLKKKFDVDAANWVWNKETANQKIKEVITEYKIIIESNKILPKSTSYNEAISAWCDKCNYIRISYEASKNYLDEIKPFLEMLLTIKKSGILLDSQKEKFLDLLMLNGEKFKKFVGNQIELFKQVCEYYVSQFSNEEIQNLFSKLPTGLFIKEKSDYIKIVSEKVEEFKKLLGKEKLKALWNEKTGVSSPNKWSSIHKTPILCMVNEKDVLQARKAFDAINKSKPSAIEIDEALKYLENADFYEKLNDEEAINKAFVDKVIKTFSVILTDIDEVKNYLSCEVGEVDEWYMNPIVEKKLAKMTEAKYIEFGYNKALEKIDNIEVADLRKYLKNLIKNNMIIGIEIIKNM